MINMVCKSCGKKFHYCSSCDHSGMQFADEGYCSEVCWHKCAEYKRNRSVFRMFLNCLSVDELNTFRRILDLGSFYDGEIETWFKEWINESTKSRQ